MRALLQIFITMTALGLWGLPSHSFAQVTPHKSTRLQVFQINYSGEQESSFSETKTGFGVEAYSDYGRNWGRVYSKVRGTQSSGAQSFLDGSTSRDCTYTFYQGQFEAGFVLAPIPPRDTGINIFLSGGGSIGYNWLSLSSSTTLTDLKPSESAMSFGYSAGMGMEWVLTKGVGKRKMLTGEINYRVESVSLAGQSSFDLSGLSIHMGYGW